MSFEFKTKPPTNVGGFVSDYNLLIVCKYEFRSVLYYQLIQLHYTSDVTRNCVMDIEQDFTTTPQS